MDSYPGDERDLASKFVAANVYLAIVIVADIRVVKVRDFVLRHFCSTAVSATIRLCLSRGMNPLLLCSKANYSRTFRTRQYDQSGCVLRPPRTVHGIVPRAPTSVWTLELSATSYVYWGMTLLLSHEALVKQISTELRFEKMSTA